MSEEDISLDEKRIYGEKRATETVYVASGVGLARVSVSGDQAGRLSLDQRGTVRDVAGADGRLLVATPEDVLVGSGEGLDATGFGEAIAVGVGDGGGLLAARPDGEIARLAGDDWQSVGRVDEPRRIDGRYVAAADGVHRVDDGDLVHLGLDDVQDVAAAGPYAATGDALYRHVDGEWTVARDGSAERVAARPDATHVVTGTHLFESDGDRWSECQLPVDERVADVAYGDAVYGVTVDGTFLVEADPEKTPDGHGGWRHRSLGVPNVTAIAVP